MKLSFWTLGTPGWSLDAVLDSAQRYRFDGVDLRCAENGNVSVGSSDSDVSDLKNQFASQGIEIASLLAYNKRGTPAGVDWDAVAEDLVAHEELCQRLGVTNLRVNIGEPATGTSWDAYLDGFALAVRKALNAVDGVVMNFQNHPGSLDTVQAAGLCERVASKRFGIGFSTDHCVDMGEDPLEAAKRVGRWVKHVHMADRATADGEMTQGKYYASLPGKGVVPNAAVLDVLRQQGFDGWVSFKWEKPTWPELPDAEIALPEFVSFLRPLVTSA